MAVLLRFCSLKRVISNHLFRMATSEKERINKLECRAREAENALQQLRAYVELLKKKAKESVSSVDASSLEAENEMLRKEIALIKQQLILEELKNGVIQYAMPSELPPKQSTTNTTTPSTSSNPPKPKPSQPETSSQANKELPKKKKEEQPKSKKEGKQGAKGGGGGGAKGGDKPVDVSRLDMRIGKILKAWKHPDADGLYVEEVDVGEPGKTRTVCSGLVDHVALEQMQERMAVFLCNLKPAKMRGISSEAMVMCASSPEKVEILDPPAGCVVGERVVCAGYEGEPDAQLNPKKKVFEAVQPDFRTNDECVACYKGVPFTVPGKGVCRSQTMKGTGIK